MRVALAGNPNAGKTTLFNALSGMRAHTGNYGGVTVEQRQAVLLPAAASPVTLIDLPGCYSLTARSADEDVAQRVLLGDGAPGCDWVLCVVDATQLGRSLYLLLQLRELGLPILVVLNRMDAARARHLQLDVAQLSSALGLAIYPCSAKTGEGLPALRDALRAHAQTPHTGLQPTADVPNASVLDVLDELQPAESAVLAPLAAALHASQLHVPKPMGLALWLATSRLDTLRLQLPQALRAQIIAAQHRLNPPGEEPAFNRRVINARFAKVDSLVALIQTQQIPPHRHSRRIDDVLLHPLFGAAGLTVALFVMFQATFALAQPIIGCIEAGVALLADGIAHVVPNSLLQSLLIDGVLAGAGNVAAFVPQIAGLFLGLSILEGSGYMARAALLLDRAMRQVGLSGRAFIPLMSSFGCAIPGILATRTIENPRDRLRTMLIAPLMSCSARLPVYTLVISAVFSHVPPVFGLLSVGGLVVFAMYTLGFAAALTTAALLRLWQGGERSVGLLMELPDYQWPQPVAVLQQVMHRSWQFVRGSGGTIVTLSVLLWALLTFPRSTPPPPEVLWQSSTTYLQQSVLQTPQTADAAPTPARLAALTHAWRLEHSIAGRIGHFIEPALRPLGFDWRIGVGLLASFAAREVLVSTLAQTYAVDAPEAQDDSAPRVLALRDALQADKDAIGKPRFTALTGVSLMVFFVLALQCMSTVAVLRRETGGWRWPMAALAYMNALAYLASLAVYQIGLRLGFG